MELGDITREFDTEKNERRLMQWFSGSYYFPIDPKEFDSKFIGRLVTMVNLLSLN